jgi:hypothetical protein
MTDGDEIERAFLRAAAAALNRRAERQKQVARDRSRAGDHGVVIRDGEAVIADRLARTFEELASEFEAEMAVPVALGGVA